MPTLSKNSTVYQKQLAAVAQAYYINNLGQMLEDQKKNGYLAYVNDLRSLDSSKFNDSQYGITLTNGDVRIDAAHVQDKNAWSRLSALYDTYLLDADWYVPFDATIRTNLVKTLEERIPALEAKTAADQKKIAEDRARLSSDLKSGKSIDAERAAFRKLVTDNKTDANKLKALRDRVQKCNAAEKAQSYTDYLKVNFPHFLPPIFNGFNPSTKTNLGMFGPNAAGDYVVNGMVKGGLKVRAITRPGITAENAFVGGFGEGFESILSEQLEEYYSGNLFKENMPTVALLNTVLGDETTNEETLSNNRENLKEDVLAELGKVEKATKEFIASANAKLAKVEQDGGKVDETAKEAVQQAQTRLEKLLAIKTEFQSTDLKDAAQLRALTDKLSATGLVPLQQLAAHVLVEVYKKYLPKSFKEACAILKKDAIEVDVIPNTADARNGELAGMTTKMWVIYIDDLSKNDEELKTKAGLVRGAGDDAVNAKLMPVGKFISHAFSQHAPMECQALLVLDKANKLSEEAKQEASNAVEGLLEESPVLKFVAELEAGRNHPFPENIKGDTQYAQLRNAVAYLHEKGADSYNDLDGSERITQAITFLNDTLFGKVNRKETLSQETVDRLNNSINLTVNVSHYVYRKSGAVNANNSVGSVASSTNAAPVVNAGLTLTVTTATPNGKQTLTLTTMTNK